VVDRVYTTSIVLAVARVIEDFAPRTVAELDDAAVARVLELRPDVVLLGTGARIVFPPPRVLAAFLQRRVGCEALDHGAAGRTFNVLAGEGRNAVAVFLFDSGVSPA